MGSYLLTICQSEREKKMYSDKDGKSSKNQCWPASEPYTNGKRGIYSSLSHSRDWDIALCSSPIIRWREKPQSLCFPGAAYWPQHFLSPQVSQPLMHDGQNSTGQVKYTELIWTHKKFLLDQEDSDGQAKKWNRKLAQGWAVYSHLGQIPQTPIKPPALLLERSFQEGHTCGH